MLILKILKAQDKSNRNVKKFKIETLSCKLCIQHIKTSKNKFFLPKFHESFLILNH